MRLAMRAGAVALVMLGFVTGCGGGEAPEAKRPPRITESFKPELLDPWERKAVCVPGTGGDALTCEALVHHYMDSLHKLRDTIKARPDADKYPKTLAGIEAADKWADEWTKDKCPGKLGGDCSRWVENIFSENVYDKLNTEDSLTKA
jgi:hypothetical protein